MIPKVSVVVCTRNRSKSLRHALQSLLVLETHGEFTYEIIVVNNNSSDDTSQVVERIARSTAVPIREVIEQKPGVVPARNRGVAEAGNEWIAFFDDDQLADREWLSALMQLAVAKRCRCVGGAVLLSLPENESRDLSPTCRMLLGETVNRPDIQKYTPRQTPGTGNLMVHRDVFDEIGLFNEEFNTRGEDTDLFLRMHAANIVAWYTPEAVVYHVIPPARLTASYLLQLAETMSDGMAVDERQVVGKTRYPLYWSARFLQTALVIFPRYCLAALLNRKEEQLGWQCRLQIAKHYLMEGFPLLLPRA